MSTNDFIIDHYRFSTQLNKSKYFRIKSKWKSVKGSKMNRVMKKLLLKVIKLELLKK